MMKPWILAIGLLCSIVAAQPPKLPAAVRINDTLWAYRHEITNLSWKEYMGDVGCSGPDIEAMWPDTAVWKGRSETLCRNYFQHPGFQMYPVVGVSYGQVQSFCAWMAKVLTEDMGEKATGYRLEIRLPTQAEWLMIARMPDSKGEAWTVNHISNTVLGKAKRMANLENQLRFMPSPVQEYGMGPAQLYCVYGNVAEMLHTEGECMGGGFAHTPTQAFSANPILYTQPEAWLGFRPVAIWHKIP